MSACRDGASPGAGHQDRKVFVVVAVAIAKATAVNDHAVVQQRTVAFTNGLQSPQQIRKLFHMEAVDFANFGEFLCVSAVM